MQRPIPLTRDVVFIGGGHAHALVLRRWGMKPLAGVRLTVIDPNPTAPYSGMLPGYIAGHYRQADLEIDLVKLCRFAGARLVVARVVGIDRDARRVQVEGRPDIFYDIASIDIGITSDLPSLPGFAEHAVGAKPLGDYTRRWRGFLDDVAAGRVAPEIAVIGGGVAGVELVLAMHHALKTRGAQPQVTVIEARRALPDLGDKTRRALLRRLEKAGIGLIEGVGVVEVCADRVLLSDGAEVASAFTLGVAGARPQEWLRDTGLDLHEGFVKVGPTLHTLTDTRIFAAGDIAHLTHAPRPKAGVYAVREAPFLYDNILAALTGGKPRKYRPQKDYLKLISLGGREALADKFTMRGEGAGLWRLKDRIDRKFMRKFHELPEMKAPALPPAVADGVREMVEGHPPLCGGCGAKVAAGPLRESLAGLKVLERDDIKPLPGDDAAAVKCGDGFQVISTDHLRAFTADHWQMARIAANHALGDIWAMGARPQSALASITLPEMRPTMQRATLDEIMAAATEVFSAAGAAIIGGHTMLGAELVIGFTVTGLCKRPITLAGARAGDALVLTGPIGSGVVLAAEMRGQADGRDVVSAWREMGRDKGPAAALLTQAHAMTDVTGFGLAGHLMGMLGASKLAARLDLAMIPLMQGAEALAAAGVRSSLYQGNRASLALDLPESPRSDLLYDPQTAGGLLAAVDGRQAGGVVEKLRAEGYSAAIIGWLEEGAPSIRLAD